MRQIRRGFPRGRGGWNGRSIPQKQGTDENTQYFEALMRKSAARRGGVASRGNVGWIGFADFGPEIPPPLTTDGYPIPSSLVQINQRISTNTNFLIQKPVEDFDMNPEFPGCSFQSGSNIEDREKDEVDTVRTLNTVASSQLSVGISSNGSDVLRGYNFEITDLSKIKRRDFTDAFVELQRVLETMRAFRHVIDKYSMIPKDIVVGEIYLVKNFTSGRFYRGRLTEIYDDHFVVSLIDNHVTTVVNKENVREYPNVPQWFCVPKHTCPSIGLLSLS
ncbi:hypothetical protein FO519_005360 [Halicephalobus sp. NKZ332]|nr:hypothetical protein FO519_005360 [Halicephalobus sp. NKZ332]